VWLQVQGTHRSALEASARAKIAIVDKFAHARMVIKAQPEAAIVICKALLVEPEASGPSCKSV
jgi:hypothetical protein